MIFQKKKRKSSVDLKMDGNDIHEVCKSKFRGVLINWTGKTTFPMYRLKYPEV